MSTRTLCILSFSAILSCASGEARVFAPVQTTSAELSGAPAAVTQIPGGEVRVASSGLAHLAVRDGTLHAIHVELAFTNRGYETWTVDGREQSLTVDGEPSAAAVTATGDAPETIVVPPGSMRWMELFFPLSNGYGVTRAVPSFDVAWKLRIGDRGGFVEHTSFRAR